MTITFFSNFLNHHQLPLCEEFIKQIGGKNFHFVACEPIDLERINMGYEDVNLKYSFVVRAYESQEQFNYAYRLACDSDIAIIGSALGLFAEIRAKYNKLTFLFRERIFKNSSWHRFIPTTAYTIYTGYIRYRNCNFYILCASAYTAEDLELCGFPRQKCLKWGYFPELLPKVEKKYDKLRIMWCGRMLWWKHPEDAVKVARIINNKSIDFEMKIIGNGEKREYIESLIDRYNLRSKVFTYNFMPPIEVRKIMNDSNVYLFTSGKQEGWGVVLNEAMNSGCAVIANINAGSTHYLIENGINGIMYDGTEKKLKEAVDTLLFMPISSVSKNAYNTISQIWNPEFAVKRLLTFITNNFKPFGNGPCSLA